MPVIFPVSKPSSMCWVRFNLGSTRFSGAEASLLWYNNDMFDNGRQAVQYQALVQCVEPEVTQKGN